MFKKMRRIDKQLSQEENIGILNAGKYGVLSTISTNGYPYGVALNYAYYMDSIYFHTAVKGHTLENIENNCNVAFCVAVDVQILPDKFDTLYKSVILFGKAKEVFDLEKDAALLALIEKYSGQYMEQGKAHIQNDKARARVIRIEIEHMTGKEGK
jgi:nitroimidazol reductase NimA-like FMN-containing flavoprotein (pyridoxamine 5'-phosphate oxidase superfamily)